jgi:protein-tyrosine phosphatase
MRTRVFWIHPQVGIMGRPMGGDDFLEELSYWQKLAVKTIVSLLTDEENEELDLEFERMDCTRAGFEFIKFPIEPKSVPDSLLKTRALLAHLLLQVEDGGKILLHSRAGVGRSVTLGVLLLAKLGLSFDEALAKVIQIRGVNVPDQDEQLRWLKSYLQG